MNDRLNQKLLCGTSAITSSVNAFFGERRLHPRWCMAAIMQPFSRNRIAVFFFRRCFLPNGLVEACLPLSYATKCFTYPLSHAEMRLIINESVRLCRVSKKKDMRISSSFEDNGSWYILIFFSNLYKMWKYNNAYYLSCGACEKSRSNHFIGN